VRVSLVGIEILTIDARIVVASVDTYLRFAEAVNRLELPRAEPRLPGSAGQAAGGAASAPSVLPGAATPPGGGAGGQGQQAPAQPSRPEQGS
jgi:hypothetical protein